MKRLVIEIHLEDNSLEHNCSLNCGTVANWFELKRVLLSAERQTYGMIAEPTPWVQPLFSNEGEVCGEVRLEEATKT